MAYVYIHRRKTDGLVFYVGKGTGRRKDKRGRSRSTWWNSVVNKHGYTIEVLRDGMSDQEAYDMEARVIKKYRRLNMPLVNMNEGGKGNTSGGLQSEFPELYPGYYNTVYDLKNALPEWWHNKGRI